MNINLSQVKFYTGIEANLDDKPIENGAIYFIPQDDDSAIIAYDMNNNRYWISHPSVVTAAELTSSWIPKRGEIVVVSNATINDDIWEPYVKIGDGITNAAALPYIDNNTRVDALRNVVNTHLGNNNIHHTVTVTGTTYVVEGAIDPNYIVPQEGE